MAPPISCWSHLASILSFKLLCGHCGYIPLYPFLKKGYLDLFWVIPFEISDAAKYTKIFDLYWVVYC